MRDRALGEELVDHFVGRPRRHQIRQPHRRRRELIAHDQRLKLIDVRLQRRLLRAEVERQRPDVRAGAGERDVTAQIAQRRNFLIGYRQAHARERDCAVGRQLAVLNRRVGMNLGLACRVVFRERWNRLRERSDIEIVGVDARGSRAAADFDIGRLRIEVAERYVGERKVPRRAGVCVPSAEIFSGWSAGLLNASPKAIAGALRSPETLNLTD